MLLHHWNSFFDSDIKFVFTLRKLECSKHSYDFILQHGIIHNDID